MIVAALPHAVDTAAAYAVVFADEPVCAWLDSARVEEGLAGVSYLAAPGPTGEVLTYAVGRPHVEVRRGDLVTREPGTIWDALGRRADDRGAGAGAPGDDLPPGLVDGWVGYLGYELKRDLGCPGRHVPPHPDAVWLRAERLLVVDHLADRAWLVGHGADAAEWVARASEALAGLGGGAVSAVGPSGAPAAGAAGAPGAGAAQTAGTSGTEVPGAAYLPDRARLVRGTTTYRRDVEACLEELRRGESYEICLTDTVEVDGVGDPVAAYLRLRERNPAPHAALLRLPGLDVLSASPELYLAVDRDGWATTKPIKGTAPRHRDPVEDARVAAGLAADPKTRAENLMIADLLRNDLSQVCDPATVQVPHLMAVESYATVHQLVTTVRGRLRDGVTGVDAARACFPAGSMTGAPKHRTMQIIDGLETRARGVYSGALGWLDRSGALDLSVVIRTAVVAGDRATVGAGGAIVLDSDPGAETEEMLLKAAGVVPALLPDA